MLCLDLIIYICEYLEDTNYYLLNKSIYESVIMMEKGKYWKEKYDNFFKKLNKEYLILNGDYNWKREYMRIVKFNYWSKLNNKDKILMGMSSFNSEWQKKYYYGNEKFNGLFHEFPPKKFWNELPKEIGNLTNYEVIWLHNKDIEIIPKEIGNLINLRTLILSENKIKRVPKEIINLINLEIIDLSKNKLERIPKEIVNLTNLNILGLADNKIKRVPKEMVNLINLEQLYLCDNKLKGIPEELNHLTNLKKCDIIHGKTIGTCIIINEDDDSFIDDSNTGHLMRQLCAGDDIDVSKIRNFWIRNFWIKKLNYNISVDLIN